LTAGDGLMPTSEIEMVTKSTRIRPLPTANWMTSDSCGLDAVAKQPGICTPEVRRSEDRPSPQGHPLALKCRSAYQLRIGQTE